LYAKQREATGISILKLQKRIDRAELNLDLQGANPKLVPFAVLKEHIQAPAYLNQLEDKYLARINNRAKAIRAYCVNCQGFELIGVKECSSLNCPLHPFRMGKDPLRGWEIPKAEELELDDEEEDIGEFEDGETGSEKDD